MYSRIVAKFFFLYIQDLSANWNQLQWNSLEFP